jgi:hypothetical protein
MCKAKSKDGRASVRVLNEGLNGNSSRHQSLVVEANEGFPKQSRVSKEKSNLSLSYRWSGLLNF